MTGVRFPPGIFLLIILRPVPEPTQPSSLSVYVCIVPLLRFLSLSIGQRPGVNDENHVKSSIRRVASRRNFKVRTCRIRSRNTNHSSEMVVFISSSFNTRERINALHCFCILIPTTRFGLELHILSIELRASFWPAAESLLTWHCQIFPPTEFIKEFSRKLEFHTFKRSVVLSADRWDPVVVPTWDL
jgi:hypothetical protein